MQTYIWESILLHRTVHAYHFRTLIIMCVLHLLSTTVSEIRVKTTANTLNDSYFKEKLGIFG